MLRLISDLIGFRGVFRQISQTYDELDENDRKLLRSLVRSSLVVLVIIISAYLISKMLVKPDSLVQIFINVFIALSSSFYVALLFAIFDRIGLLIPIEKGLSALLKSHANSVAAFNQTQQMYQGFTNYRESQSIFGFEAVIGEVSPSAASDTISNRAIDEYNIRLISSLGRGDIFQFMNTYIDNPRDYCSAMESAVSRGANFELLLLKPDIEAAAVQARFKDYGEKAYNHPDIESFVQYFGTQTRMFYNLKNVLDERRNAKPDLGKLEIRLYSRSLNMPMVLVSRATEGKIARDSVYTGFYGLESSEAMPYIKWSVGQFDLIGKFFGIFNNKWKKCKDETELPKIEKSI